MKRTVTVLQDDIDNGEPWRVGRCALALAAKRELADLPGADRLAVGGYIHAMFWQALLPEEAQCFRRDFDHKRPVEPFKFEVEIESTGRETYRAEQIAYEVAYSYLDDLETQP